MKRISKYLTGFMFAAWTSGVAAIPILTFTGGTPTSPIEDAVGGWEFQVTSAISVDGLGLWDDDSDGLDRNHDVGLWTLGGILLASTTITNASATEANGAGPGRWLFNDISQLVLGPGNYVLGATYIVGDSDQLMFDSALTTIAGVDYVIGLGEPSSVLTFPESAIGGTTGFFGPNLRLADSSVPAPATLALLGIGLAGIGWARRRKV